MTDQRNFRREEGFKQLGYDDAREFEKRLTLAEYKITDIQNELKEYSDNQDKKDEKQTVNIEKITSYAQSIKTDLDEYKIKTNTKQEEFSGFVKSVSGWLVTLITIAIAVAQYLSGKS